MNCREFAIATNKSIYYIRKLAISGKIKAEKKKVYLNKCYWDIDETEVARFIKKIKLHEL